MYPNLVGNYHNNLVFQVFLWNGDIADRTLKKFLFKDHIANILLLKDHYKNYFYSSSKPLGNTFYSCTNKHIPF